MQILGKCRISSRTDIGLLRQYNEDNCFVCDVRTNTDELGVLVGVADGMGGHNGGDVASQLAVNTLASYYTLKGAPDSLAERLVRVVERANQAIFEVSSENTGLTGMGTTMTSMVLFPEEAIIGHVGDSRAYLWRDEQFIQITEDHSLVAQAVREGILTPEQAARHPQRNIITRALGTRETVEVDSLTIKVQTGDVFLLATDGLHGFSTDEELSRIVKEHFDNTDEMTDELIQLTLEKGAPDNVTVVVVAID